MLSVIDIIKSLSLLVEKNFPNYPVNDRDLQEGFERPSYFIDVEDVQGENLTACYVKETANLSLYFFEEDIYSGFLKLLDMKNKLLELLREPLALADENGVIVAHVVFNDVGVTISKADKALTCTMTSELVQAREDSEKNLPFIESIEIKSLNLNV